MWAKSFHRLASWVLGFTGNTYTSMTTEADRYASLALLQEVRVTVSFEKRMLITPELEVVGSCVYSLEDEERYSI